MAQHQIAVNTLVAKDKANIGVADILQYLETLALIDFPSDDDVPNLRAVRELVGAYTAPAVAISISPQPTFTYTLNSTELAGVNAIGRIPNFVGLVNNIQYYDIFPTYTGSAGLYSQIVVTLHNNTQDHLVQFS